MSLFNKIFGANSKKLRVIAKRFIIEEPVEKEEIIKKIEQYRSPSTLQERLDIYKKMIGEIKEDSQMNIQGDGYHGYQFDTSDGHYVKVMYEFISNHFVINKSDSWYGWKAIAVFEKDQEQEAKNYCCKKIIKYIRSNTKFLYDKFWSIMVYPIKNDNGGITTVSAFPFLFKEEYETPEQERLSKWKRLDDDTRWKFNKLREEHGLERII